MSGWKLACVASRAGLDVAAKKNWCLCWESKQTVEASWNVMAHAQKPDFVFRRNGRVHLNWPGRQFSRLLAAEVCASAVVMLDTPCSEVVWGVLATHSIRQFPLHFPSRASFVIIFQLESTTSTTGSNKPWVSLWVHDSLFLCCGAGNKSTVRPYTPPDLVWCLGERVGATRQLPSPRTHSLLLYS